jgi:hypothetical protein
MIDTLKTTSVGAGGLGIQYLNMLPEAVKVVIGIITIGYLIVKIKNELSKK